MTASGFILLSLVFAGFLSAQQNDSISGVVASSKGPEAGVWVIAETTDLGTRYIKEVVTDDQGRYLIPDLPAASYAVWARGYGLVDSPRVTVKSGQQRNFEGHQDAGAVAASDQNRQL